MQTFFFLLQFELKISYQNFIPNIVPIPNKDIKTIKLVKNNWSQDILNYI